MRFYFSLFALSQIQIVYCWDLNILKISPTYYASSIAVFKNRAFLALPRSSCFNNVTNPTLVEVPWSNESRYGVFRKKMYPNYKEQKWGVCKDHQDVVSVDLEVKKAKLWVLDKGNQKCSPKIVIYNLYYNTIGQSSRLSDYSGEKLNYIVVDPNSDIFGGRAFIGGLENSILIFSTRTMKVAKVKFISTTEMFTPIATQFLSMSFMTPVLYITSSKDFNLYSIALEALRKCEGSLFNIQELPCEANVTLIGEKLGPSSGMVTDFDGNLYYYLTRDYAIVKWIEDQPLQAEYHSVLKQSYEELPYVSHMFLGPHSQPWALVNAAKTEICTQKYKDTNIYKNLPKVNTRIVKI